MDLWIRSQDKTSLRKVQGLNITCGEEGFYIEEYDTDTLGRYKTQERALEVLDEIQSLLMPKFMFKNSGWRKCNTYLTEVFPVDNDIECQNIESYVYEMPKE